jgi:hypothetical protein
LCDKNIADFSALSSSLLPSRLQMIFGQPRAVVARSVDAVAVQLIREIGIDVGASGAARMSAITVIAAAPASMVNLIVAL